MEAFTTSQSRDPTLTSDGNDDNLVFIMNVKRKDGTADRVVVRPSDDPYKLALDYVQKYKLSDNVVEKLANKIDNQRRIFLLSVLERDNSYHPTMTNEEERADNFASQGEKILNNNAISPSQDTVENFLSQFIPPIEKSEEGSGNTQEDASPLSPNSAAEDAYNRARGTWKQLDSSSITVHKSASEGSRKDNLMSPDIYIHSSTPEMFKSRVDKSASRSSSKTVFQRLYDSASKFKERQSIRKKMAEEKELEDIEKSKFYLPDDSPYSPKNFRSLSRYPGKNFGEKLYASGQIWENNVKKKIESEREKRAEKQREDDEKNLTFKPLVEPAPLEIRDKIKHQEGRPAYKQLYEHQEVHDEIVDNLKTAHENQLADESPFRPHVDARSVKLSARGRARRRDVENMIKEESLYGKSKTGDNKLTRRKSVWKALVADFPLSHAAHAVKVDNNLDGKLSTPLSAREGNQVSFREPEAATGKLSSIFSECSTPDENRMNLAEMLHEDSIRVGELIEEQRKRSAEKEAPSQSPGPSSFSKCKFYVPSPGGAVLRSPVFRSTDVEKQQVTASPKKIDPSKRKIGELDPKTIQDLKSASSRLNEQIMNDTPSRHHKGFKGTIFERLYQDHFYRTVHSIKREMTQKECFPHRPDIGVNTYMGIEKRGKDFYQRLYEHEGNQQVRGNKRSSSADGTRGRNAFLGESNRSRSVSRQFTAGRRREFQVAQKLLDEKIVKRKTPCKDDRFHSKGVTKRPPWGHYGGNFKGKLESQKGPFPSPGPVLKGKEPVFYKFVFNDHDADQSTTSMITPIKGDTDYIIPSNKSRAEQLKILEDKYFAEVVPQEKVGKIIDEHEEQLLVDKMQRDVVRRKKSHEDLVNRVELSVKKKTQKSYTLAKSLNLVESKKRQALSEIFNVLLVSVEYAKTVKEKTYLSGDHDSETGSQDDNDIGSKGLLDTSLVMPQLLKPSELVYPVGQIIEKYKPRPLSRDMFIVAMSNLMTSGRCAPLNFLLCIPTTPKVNRMQSNEKAEDFDVSLHRPSRQMTEAYLRDRKASMQEENIAHHDLIYSYDQIYRQKLEANRDWLMKKERTIYTFKPIISTRPAARQYWIRRANARLNASIQNIDLSTDENINQQNTSLDDSLNDASMDNLNTDDKYTSDDFAWEGKGENPESSDNYNDDTYHHDDGSDTDCDKSPIGSNQNQLLHRQPSYVERYLNRRSKKTTGL